MTTKSSKRGLKVAVVGVTGAVGREMLAVMEGRKFPVQDFVGFASARSEGKNIRLNDKTYRCQSLKKGCFEGVDLAFFDASDSISNEWVPEALNAGAWVVDNSSAHRMKPDVPLIVPEVNGHALEKSLKTSPSSRLVAGPNCSVAQLVVALKPLHEKWGIKRVVVSTYQSTSGAGTAAMDELSRQTVAMFNQGSIEPKFFPHQIAFNCIPQIGSFKENGNTSEENKMIEEARKLLEIPGLKISVTAVRVPTFSCHAESVNVEFEKSLTPEEAREVLNSADGIQVLDDPSKNIYPMGFTHSGGSVEAATGRDAVYVGRIRRDESTENGLNFWVVSDNLRKGAALNAIQIGEVLLRALV
ncbi:aspartate-semialdehyde dehydrogenase [bacterium]|nr:aspartate-semialdehyde dehydrogenase [bacterium]